MTTKLSRSLGIFTCAISLHLWSVPAQAQSVPSGTSCILKKALDASTEPGGRGDKQPLPKGVLIVAGDTEKGWTQITAGSKGEFTGYVGAKALARFCEAVGRTP